MKPKLCKIYFSRLTTLHTNRILKCLIYARNVNKRKIIRTSNVTDAVMQDIYSIISIFITMITPKTNIQ